MPRRATLPPLRASAIPRWWWVVLLLAVVLWLARDVLGPFVVAGVLAYAFGPLVEAAAQRTGRSRGLVVTVAYAVALVVIGVVVLAVARPLGRDIGALATQGPDAVAALLRAVLGRDTITIAGTSISVTSISAQLRGALGRTASSPSDALHLLTLLGTTLLDAVLVLIVTFYLLLDAPRVRGFGLRLFEPVTRRRVETVTARIHVILGRWLRGQLFLIGLVAAVVYVALGPILHLPYATGIAAVTGVLEIIPLVGPIVAATIATLVAFGHGGPGLAIVVIVLYTVLREVEDQVVMPVVIGRAVHLHPVVTIFAVLVGLSAWGILGGLLAVPVTAAINVTLAEVYPQASTLPDASAEATGTPVTSRPAQPERARGGLRRRTVWPSRGGS